VSYTKGPWTITSNKIDGNGYHLASINASATTEGKANARLISAAPDLLEALQEIIKCVDSNTAAIVNRVVEQSRAAIAKATCQ